MMVEPGGVPPAHAVPEGEEQEEEEEEEEGASEVIGGALSWRPIRTRRTRSLTPPRGRLVNLHPG